VENQDEILREIGLLLRENPKYLDGEFDCARVFQNYQFFSELLAVPEIAKSEKYRYTRNYPVNCCDFHSQNQ